MATLRAAMHEIQPDANSTATQNVCDVVGHKSDTQQTTIGTTRSLMAYLKGVLSKVLDINTSVTVPSPDETASDNLSEVVGHKSDASQNVIGTTRSLMGYLKGVLNTVVAIDTAVGILSEHVHGICKVYPTLAVGVPVISSGTQWDLGNFVEVVPANTIASVYDIHEIKIEGFNKTGTYELVLYKGATDIEVGRVRITRDSNSPTFGFSPFMTYLIPANERIRAKVAHSADPAATLTISIKYHTY